MPQTEVSILDQVEEYASLFFTVDEIALLIDRDPVDLRREIRHGKSELARRYQKGKLGTMLEMRRVMVQFAKKGSPQAEMILKEFFQKMEGSE
ncbi:hypothetical protein [Mangrovibacterium sp.]|uniref:hypothetical protein n=1 Tax=Mangrovibacterium sp. TaxID=1961364 RepID=UPI0035658B62